MGVAEKWPEQVWQKLNLIGGKGGKPFSFIGSGGTFVKQIRLYKHKKGSKKSLCGIDITFTDDTNEKAGVLDQDGSDFIFESGEKVKSLTLWGNGIGTRTGRIQFETVKGGTFDWGQNTEGQSSYATDVGSGLLIGFIGRADKEIDCLAAVFLKPIETAFVDNVKYPDLDLADTSAMSLKTLDAIQSTWPGGPYVFRFIGSTTETATTTFNNTKSVEVGVELTMKAGVPLFAEGEIKTSFKIGSTRDWGGSDTRSHMLQWNTEHKIEKEEDLVKCTAECYEGKLDIKYTGTFHVVMKDDQTFAFPTKGTLKQITFSKVMVRVKKVGYAGAARSLEDPSDENGHVGGEAQESEVDHKTTEIDGDTPEDEADDAENEEGEQQADAGDDQVEEIEAEGTADGTIDDEQDQHLVGQAEDNEEDLLEEEAGNVEGAADRAAEEDEEALPEEDQQAGDVEVEENAVADDEEVLPEEEEDGDVEAEEEPAAEDDDEAVLEESGEVEAEEEAAVEDDEDLPEEEEAGDVEAEEEAVVEDDEALPEEEAAGDIEAEEETAVEDEEGQLVEAGKAEAEEEV